MTLVITVTVESPHISRQISHNIITPARVLTATRYSNSTLSAKI